VVKVIKKGQWFQSSHAGLGCQAINSSTFYLDQHWKNISEEDLRKIKRRWKAKAKKRKWKARLNLTHQL